MPKQTFFNLPNEKKEPLIKAGMKEFSRVPLYEASISNIIKEAEIPRGSFYRYFEDKEDFYFFLLNLHGKKITDRFKSILTEKNGDISNAFIEFFRYMLMMFQNSEYQNFFRNAFLNMTYKIENSLVPNVKKAEFKNRLLETIALINTQSLNISDEQELIQVFKLVMRVMFNNLIESFAKNLTLDESLKNFKFDLSVIKKGIYKEGYK